MHRNKILQQLNDYRLSKWYLDQEEKLVNQFIYFITQNTHCFSRSLKKGHLTASCWLWNEEETACLFTLHKKLKKWIQLGGHADGQFSLLEVAIKEAQEESGIEEISAVSPEIFDISIHEIPAYKEVPSHLHYDVRYLLKVNSNAPLIISEESDDLKWITLENFKNYPLDPSILKMRQKIIESKKTNTALD